MSAIESRFWEKVDKNGPGGCWVWLASKNEHGYGKFGVTPSSSKRAHRVAWTLAGNSLSDDEKLLHSCDNPACVNPAHLRPGTQAENLADMRARGRGIRGETHPNSKLTAEKAQVIRFLRASTLLADVEIGALFLVGRSAVQKVVARTTWAHVPDIDGAKQA